MTAPTLIDRRAALALPAGVWAARGSAAPPRPATGPTAVALLVAFQEYAPTRAKGLGKLAHPVASAVALANALLPHGYSVRVLTDPGQAGRVEEGVKAAAKAAGRPVEVAGVTTAAEVEGAVAGWAARAANPDYGAGFALLTLSGHGLRRGGANLLLAPGDDPAAGGVDLARLQRALDAGPPTVLVVDACRTGDDPPVALAAPANRQRAEGVRGVIRAAGDAPAGVTRVFAVPPGAAAADQRKDFVACLAAGLKTTRDRQFAANLAAPFVEAAMFPDQDAHDLRLFNWLYHAETEYLKATLLGGTDAVRWGKAGPWTPVARRTGVPGQVIGRLGAVDLLAGVREFAGGLRVERLFDVLRVSRLAPPAGQKDSVYCYADLASPQAAGGRTLAVGVLAEGGTIGFQVHTKNQQAAAYLNPTATTTTYRAPAGVPTMFYVPLASQGDERAFDQLALAARQDQDGKYPSWPVGATLTVTRLQFLDSAGLPAKLNRGEQGNPLPAAAAYPNLLGRWWNTDSPPDGLGQLEATAARGRGITLTPADPAVPGSGWRGGLVEPPVYVPAAARRAEVRLEAVKPAADAQATVTLYAGLRVVARAELKLAQAAREKTFAVDLAPDLLKPGADPASIDYLTVRTDGTTVRLTNVAVVGGAAGGGFGR